MLAASAVEQKERIPHLEAISIAHDSNAQGVSPDTKRPIGMQHLLGGGFASPIPLKDVGRRIELRVSCGFQVAWNFSIGEVVLALKLENGTTASSIDLAGRAGPIGGVITR